MTYETAYDVWTTLLSPKAISALYSEEHGAPWHMAAGAGSVPYYGRLYHRVHNDYVVYTLGAWRR
eukprot:352474-Chlamydomonas_euryale.AAC.1